MTALLIDASGDGCLAESDTFGYFEGVEAEAAKINLARHAATPTLRAADQAELHGAQVAL